MLRYLSADIFCSWKQTVSFEEQIMPNRQMSELNDSQMEAIVTLKYFRNARDLLLKLGGYLSDVPQLF